MTETNTLSTQKQRTEEETVRRVSVRGKIRQRVEKRRENVTAKLTPKKLKLLIVIVNKNKTEFYIDLLQSFEINMQLCMLGEGTATSETRHMLGLEDSERVIIFNLVREDRANEALDVLEEKFRTVRGGKGIAYTVPLTGMVGVAIYQFLSNHRMAREEKK